MRFYTALLIFWVSFVYADDHQPEVVDKSTSFLIEAKRAANTHQWNIAEELYKKAWARSQQQGDIEETLDILFSLLTVYQQQSNGVAAFNIASEIEKLVVNLSDPFSLTRSYRLLGIAYQSLANNELARDYYSVSVEYSRELNKPALLSSLLNELGYSDVLITDYLSAKASFEESFKLARSLNEQDLMLQAQINLLRVQIALGDVKRVKHKFSVLENLIDEIPESENLMEKIISVGTLYRTAQIKLKLPGQYRKTAYLRYEHGLNLAKKYHNLKFQSIANGYMGQIYADEHQYDVAAKFTHEAILISQKLNNVDLVYRWTVQHARILSASDNKQSAFNLYQRAIELLDSLDIVNFMRYERSFNADVKPVFEELFIIMFQQLEKTKNISKKQRMLQKIIVYAEKLRFMELSAFCFGNCQFKTKDIKQYIPEKEAVLYTLVLTNELYVILKTRHSIDYQSQSVTRKSLLTSVNKLLDNISKSKSDKSHLKPAKVFYEWLISPFKNVLTKNQINSLSIIPSQELMKLPFDILYKENSYLIENFSIKLVSSAHDLNKTVNWKNKGQNHKISPSENFSIIQNTLAKVNSQQLISIENKVLLANDYRQSQLMTSDDNYPLFALINKIKKVKNDNKLGIVLLNHRSPDGVNNVYFNAQIMDATYVISPLWPYSQEVGQVLLSTFYQALKSGKNAEKSLQSAKISLIRNEDLKHPKNWAGLLLLQH